MKKSRPIVILHLLATVLLLPLLSGLFAAPVSAVTPTYTVSKAYADSLFYENLQKIKLSGDGVTDVLAVALSQLGYHEGNSEKELGGENLSGNRDFVEYNVLYGKLDNNQGNGLSYGYYWCASFVNWCLRQANVSKEASSGAFVSCWRWLDALEADGRYQPKGEYIPKAGDMIFFKDQYTYVRTGHIGFVLYADGSRVYTIEGNTSNGNEYSKDGNYVALKSYPLTSSYIVGYGCPDYTVNEDVFPVDHSGNHLSTGQFVSKEDIKCHYNAAMDGDTVTLPAHTVFAVKEVRTDHMKLEIESGGKKAEVYADIRGKAVQLSADSKTYALTFSDEDGKALLPTQFFSANSSAVIPQTRPTKKNAGFLGWSKDKNDRENLLVPGDRVEITDRDLTLWAVWDYTFYLITFKSPEGELIGQKYGYYGDILEAPEPTDIPAGIAFAGWDRPVSATITEDEVYIAVFLPEDEVTTAKETDSAAEQSSESTAETQTNDQEKEKSGCRSTVPLGVVCVMLLLVPAFCRRKDKAR